MIYIYSVCVLIKSNDSIKLGGIIQSTSRPPSLLACPAKGWLEDGLHSPRQIKPLARRSQRENLSRFTGERVCLIILD